MGRLRAALLVSMVLGLLVFGGVADRALVEQAAAAEQATRSDLEEKARLLGPSVRAALGQIEETLLAGTPVSGVMTCRGAAGIRANTSTRSQPYLQRDRAELGSLLTASTLTGNGLPESVVAAIALDDAHAKQRVADRLLSGVVPVSPNDLPSLIAALGVATDPRAPSLISCLQLVPDPAVPPDQPEFLRSLSNGDTLQAWSRTQIGFLFYEIGVRELLNRAGVPDAELARVAAERAQSEHVVSVPDVAGLTLALVPDNSVHLRVRTLRVALWIAIVTTLIGIVAILRAVNREAVAVRKEKTFLANVTHELRTPLSAIRVFGETLADGRGNPSEYGALVAQECQRLEALVEHVLTIARVDEAPTFVRVKPDEIIASALQLVATRAAMRSVRLSWDAQNNSLPDVYWDGAAVRRALLNLLDNAVKHGKLGGRVDVSAIVEGDVIRLSVADDGPGIGRRDRRRIFGRFERGASDGQGTGLGLYAVEQVARAHGGRVDLVSLENYGCTFTLVLPVRPNGVPRPETSLEGGAVDVSH